jgi:hypothetical protein
VRPHRALNFWGPKIPKLAFNIEYISTRQNKITYVCQSGWLHGLEMQSCKEEVASSILAALLFWMALLLFFGCWKFDSNRQRSFPPFTSPCIDWCCSFFSPFLQLISILIDAYDTNTWLFILLTLNKLTRRMYNRTASTFEINFWFKS